MFHLMPYRDLPRDFGERYKSAYIDPVWFDVADPNKVSQYYNWTLDEFIHAARAGIHGLCTNQHHQNVYGFMANPSLMGSVLAKLTNGSNVAIVQLGSTLPSTTPPTRVAEEYAMLDCISGGRLVAGFPTGLPTDATISNGVVPVEQRERFREALALVTKAWSAREPFAWNGRHYQLGVVNLWPRPIQQPAPPIWIPGSGISSTADYVVGLDHCFCHLSYYGAKNATTIPTGSAFSSSLAWPRPMPRPRSFMLRTPSTSSTSCSIRRRITRRSRAVSNTTRWCRRCTTIRARRSSCASSKPRTSSPAALSLSGARRPYASSSWRASNGCASATCWRSCISAPCRAGCASATSTCSRGRCCRISKASGTRDTKTAGGRSASGRSARLPPIPPAWPPHPENGEGASMGAPEVRRLRLWQGRIETEVEIAGEGPPLVYLHGPWGLGPDRAFVGRLADHHTVYAPRHPGTSRGDPTP